MCGYYWQLYNFKEYGHILETKMIYLLHTTDGSFPQVFKDLVDWMIASSSFVMIGMLAAILFGFMWYFLMIKISKIEEAEAAVLLGE
jgi:predicted membrane protein